MADRKEHKGLVVSVWRSSGFKVRSGIGLSNAIFAFPCS